MAWEYEDRQVVQLAHALWECFSGATPTNVVGIARELGVRARLDAMPARLRGCLHYHPDASHARATIYLNQHMEEEQLRYTLAHELVHYALREKMIAARPHRHERICQLGAANLLMPPARLLVETSNLYGRHDLVAYLAHRYAVSRSAMRIQLQRLGVLAHPAGAPQAVWHHAEQEIMRGLWVPGILPEVWRSVWYDRVRRVALSEE